MQCNTVLKKGKKKTNAIQLQNIDTVSARSNSDDYNAMQIFNLQKKAM